MDPVMFYGKSKKNIIIRELPEDSEDSELSCEEDEVEEDHNLSSSDSSNSDDDGDAEEDAPASSQPLANSSRPHIWRERTDHADRSSDIPNFIGTERKPGLLREPIEYFREIFTKRTFENIVTESNRYSLQQDINKPANITMDELEQFLGINFYMSVDCLPRSRLYWSPDTRVHRVADTMSQKRFEEIKRFLHFSNNENNNGDKLHKVKPLLDVFKASVNSIQKSKMMSVDEQIIPFKEKSSHKQYNPKTPKKWGYKVFVCSGSAGLIHNFEFYDGQIQPCPGKPDLGASGNINLRLMQDVPRH
ncbi:piggyBac transposable element-derived protein 2-like [Hydra vulgaris]|uniref:piggyBac transposable element-derived protein 2-like n=1 Tax=Hydra vulgaris TaxID=6087 RepID=UPI001F5E4952|nr:piggyBac transposable element-derived protein 2-like [Hydra vulgaris]